MLDKIRVLLVDDHAVVRAGIKLLLDGNADITVVGEAERGEQAWQLVVEKRPQVIVMDLSMPGNGGLETTRRLCQRDAAVSILVFSIHDQPVYVERALQAGAKGYISKSSAPEILVDAIRRLAAGGHYIEPRLRQPLSAAANPSLDGFTPREFDVFKLLAQGKTVREIAEQLNLGQKTVANYSTQIKAKLHANTLAELAHIAVVLGVVDVCDDIGVSAPIDCNK